MLKIAIELCIQFLSGIMGSGILIRRFREFLRSTIWVVTLSLLKVSWFCEMSISWSHGDLSSNPLFSLLDGKSFKWHLIASTFKNLRCVVRINVKTNENASESWQISPRVALIWVRHCCCNKSPPIQWLKTAHMLRVPEVRSLKWASGGSYVPHSLLESWGENLFSCFIRHWEAVCIHWLTAPSCIFKASGLAPSDHFLTRISSSAFLSLELHCS